MTNWEPEHRLGSTHFLAAVGFIGACLVGVAVLLWKGGL